jgi:hypothetical protein
MRRNPTACVAAAAIMCAVGCVETGSRQAAETVGVERKEAGDMDIRVEKNPSEARLDGLGVKSWPIWTKEASEFPWEYDSRETCLFLEGQVTVTPEGGKPVSFGKGDLVVFPKGMKCTWKITKDVRKHYKFD